MSDIKEESMTNAVPKSESVTEDEADVQKKPRFEVKK
eukprot:gene10589-2712_t